MTAQTRAEAVQYQQMGMFKGVKIGEKAEFYLVKQNAEEEELKRLFK